MVVQIRTLQTYSVNMKLKTCPTLATMNYEFISKIDAGGDDKLCINLAWPYCRIDIVVKIVSLTLEGLGAHKGGLKFVTINYKCFLHIWVAESRPRAMAPLKFQGSPRKSIFAIEKSSNLKCPNFSSFLHKWYPVLG